MGPQQKKTPRGGVFFFLLRPRADAHSLTAGLGGASPSPGWCFFFCCGPARTGVVFFILLWPRPDAHSLTVGWGDFGKVRVVFFFWLWPRPVFLGNSKKCLVYYIGSKKTRRGHNKKKNKNKKHHGAVFFFLLRPRADARSLTAGLGGASPSPGWCFFFAAAPPGPGWCFFFFCCGPAQTLTHSLWAGAISARFGWCFFFCCGPAGSFLVSLKRPGGAAAKKTPRGGVFFFLLRPRADAHSLTAGLGGASPSPGWCFFFCCGPARTGVVLFFCCGPAQTLTHSLWAGAISARFGWCFFFLLWPRPVFLGNSKKCLVYYIGSKKTRRGHNKKQTPLPAQHSMKGLLCAPPRGLRSDGGEGGERDCELNVEWAGSRGGSSPLCLT